MVSESGNNLFAAKDAGYGLRSLTGGKCRVRSYGMSSVVLKSVRSVCNIKTLSLK